MNNEHSERKDSSKLGKVLRLLRIAQDLSVKELAEKMEISSTYICDVESSRKRPSLDMLKKYSDALNVETSTILYFVEQNEKTNYNYQELLLKILNLLTKDSDLTSN